MHCRKKAKGIENENTNIKEHSPLEMLLTNISPNLLCEIRQCWVEAEYLTDIILHFIATAQHHNY